MGGNSSLWPLTGELHSHPTMASHAVLGRALCCISRSQLRLTVSPCLETMDGLCAQGCGKHICRGHERRWGVFLYSLLPLPMQGLSGHMELTGLHQATEILLSLSPIVLAVKGQGVELPNVRRVLGI